MSDISPFDETPARRPTVEDLGGAQKIDGPVPPNAVTMCTAHDLNEFGLVGAGVAGVCPLAIIVVAQAAGAYTIQSVRAPGSNVIAGTFTPTKNGTGDITVAWTAGALPGTVAIDASLQSGAGDYGHEDTLPSATSARIKIKDHTDTAQDSGFTLFIY